MMASKSDGYVSSRSLDETKVIESGKVGVANKCLFGVTNDEETVHEPSKMNDLSSVSATSCSSDKKEDMSVDNDINMGECLASPTKAINTKNEDGMANRNTADRVENEKKDYIVVNESSSDESVKTSSKSGSGECSNEK